MEMGVLIKRCRSALMPLLAIMAGSIGLTACTIEMGPPPESDPPLVAESQRPPPPPPQPTEPQAWSKDLDFDAGGELSVSRQQMAEGLVAADEGRAYSGEQLTFESAEERPPSEAELIRERARQRLFEAQSVSAGSPAATAPAATPAIAPPAVVAAPVEPVSAEALPEQAQSGDRNDANTEEPLSTAAGPTGPSDQAAEAPQVAEAPAVVPDAPENEKLEAVVAGDTGQAEVPVAAASETPQEAPAPPAASLAPAEKLSGEGAAAEGPEKGPPEAQQVAALALEPWDAPDGTILVQVSAIRDRQQIAKEWQRLKQGYPAVFAPLRLVVDEAKLGDRGVFFRLQAGGFSSENQAEEVCSTLTDQGQSCFVVERAAGG